MQRSVSGAQSCVLQYHRSWQADDKWRPQNFQPNPRLEGDRAAVSSRSATPLPTAGQPPGRIICAA